MAALAITTNTPIFTLGGSLFYTDVGSMYGDNPARYYTQPGLPEAEETITAGHMVDTIFTRAGAASPSTSTLRALGGDGMRIVKTESSPSGFTVAGWQVPIPLQEYPVCWPLAHVVAPQAVPAA